MDIVSVVWGCAGAGEPGPVRFRFPVEERELITGNVMWVDHDPAEYDGLEEVNCTAYDGEAYPSCYDGHDGTDFTLLGGFDTMDDGSATVVAAAPGLVVSVDDAHYDRCHVDLSTFEADCDGYEMVANTVAILHFHGHLTRYAHLMQGSALVLPGQDVDRGEPLGLVGSSGWSIAPHVHFEVEDADGVLVDPFAGPYSQDRSYWCDQESEDGLPSSDC